VRLEIDRIRSKVLQPNRDQAATSARVVKLPNTGGILPSEMNGNRDFQPLQLFHGYRKQQTDIDESNIGML
jgi:hypothetical protein